MATVNDQRASSHEAARIRETKQRRATEFLRGSQTTKHILRLPNSPRSRVLLENLLNHGRNNMSRAKAVHTNTMTAPLHSQRAGKLDNSSLGGIVHGRGHTFVSNKPAHGRNEQDRAFLLEIEHLAGCCGRRVEHAIVVDAHYLVERLLGVFQCGLEVIDARGGDEAVQALFLRGDRCEGVVDFGVVANVDFDVLQGGAVFCFCLFFGLKEVRVGCLEAV